MCRDLTGLPLLITAVPKTVRGYSQTKENLRSPSSGTQESWQAMNRGMMHKASRAVQQLPRGVST